MKNNYIKILLTGALVLSIAVCGCGKDNNADSNDNITSQSVAEVSSESSVTVANESLSDTSEDSTEEKTEKKVSAREAARQKRLNPDYTYDDFEHFEITSDSVKDGVWDSIIANTTTGENLSPDLKWDAVDGASEYILLMLDGNFLHMIATVDKTEVALGEIDGTNDNRYVGPYPPDGTHHYDVYVIAVKSSPAELNVKFDSSGNDINVILGMINTDADMNEGNILKVGEISGTYTHGE